MNIRLATNAFAAALAVAAIALLGVNSHAPAKAERLGSTASHESITSAQSALASAYADILAEPQTQGPQPQASFTVTRLTNDPNSQSSTPAWSPDGSKIAFHSDRGGNFDIYVMDADGSNVKQITDTSGATLGGGDSTRPAWSPDGSKIAYSSNSGGRDWNVLVMDADGSNIKRLADRNSEDFRPEWSPDGSWVAFTSDSDGTNDIYVVKPDGSELTQVNHTEGIHEAWGAQWSPDGTKILFLSNFDGTDDIYVADLASLRTGSQPSIIPDASNR